MNISNNQSKSPFLDACSKVDGKLFKLWKDVTVPCSLQLVYFVVGFSTRLLVLICLKIKSKTEPAYRYQVFLVVAEFIHVVLHTVAKFDRGYLSGMDMSPSDSGFRGQPWWLHCYACMYYDIHFANASELGTHMWLLVLTICITSDRIFALAKPITYDRVSANWRLQYAVLAFSFLVAFSFSFYIVFYYDVVPISYWDGSNRWTKQPRGLYLYVPGPSRLDVAEFVVVHMMTKMLFVLALVVLNPILFRVFSYRMKHRSAFMARAKNQEQMNEIVRNVKTLLALTTYQSALLVIGVCPEFVQILFSFLSRYPKLGYTKEFECVSSVGADLGEPVKEIAELLTFVIVFVFSPGFRKIVVEGVKEIRCKFRRDDRVQDIRNPNR